MLNTYICVCISIYIYILQHLSHCIIIIYIFNSHTSSLPGIWEFGSRTTFFFLCVPGSNTGSAVCNLSPSNRKAFCAGDAIPGRGCRREAVWKGGEVKAVDAASFHPSPVSAYKSDIAWPWLGVWEKQTGSECMQSGKRIGVQSLFVGVPPAYTPGSDPFH